MNSRRQSLRRRLLVGLVAVTFGYWIVVALMTVQDSVEEVSQLFDAHLAQTALALLRVTDPDETDPVRVPKPPAGGPGLVAIFSEWPQMTGRQERDRRADSGGASIPSMHADYEKHLRYQVFGRDRDLILRSANAPETAMTERDGYSETRDAEDRTWRHYGVWDQHHDFRVLVSEAHELRHGLMRGIVLHMASPLAWGLPALILLVWFSVGRGLDPLRVLTRQIRARRADNLTPLDTGSAPREVHVIVQALNALLGRVTHALEGERRFTANAAHELRTPLAALQAHLHVARHADTEEERERALDQLQLGVSRGIRVVGQMLALARLDPEQLQPQGQSVSLAEVAEGVCAELAPLSLQRGQRLELQTDPELPNICGHPDMLAVLLSNLVDNALRYTQDGGCIGISVRHDNGGVVLEVRDDGPGIPEAQRERVFERFYRIAGNDQPGTGLGLAICRRVVELHHARISLSTGRDGRGLLVGVRFKCDAEAVANAAAADAPRLSAHQVAVGT